MIFAFTLTMQEFVYALTFISSSDQKPVTLGVATDLVRGDTFYWGELMAAALIASVPVAIAYNPFSRPDHPRHYRWRGQVAGPSCDPPTGMGGSSRRPYVARPVPRP